MLKLVRFQSFVIQRTGPRTGAQNSRSRSNKFRVFFQNVAVNFGLIQWSFYIQSDFFTITNINQYFRRFFFKVWEKILITEICCARLIFDPIFARFGDFYCWILQNLSRLQKTSLWSSRLHLSPNQPIFVSNERKLKLEFDISFILIEVALENVKYQEFLVSDLFEI